MSKPNCSCLELAEPTTCASCVYGFCRRCTYPQPIECRRHAPVAPVPLEYSGQQGQFPMVWRSDWCGDFEARGTIRQIVNGNAIPHTMDRTER